MNILDVIHEDWEEVKEDFDIKSYTVEEFIEYFELTGKLMLEKSECWGEAYYDKVNLDFYCGPGIGDGCVSDCLYFNNYLKDICKELDISCDLDIAENYHRLILDSTNDGDIAFDKIKTRIEQDFEIEEGSYLA